jgi:hypothetical protein
MIIGTLAGSAVGFAWSNLPNDIERTGDERQFRRLVANSAAAAARNQPAPLRNIVVRDPERDPSNVLVYPVTYEFLPQQSFRDRARQVIARANRINATQPAAAAAATPAPQYQSTGIYAVTPFEGNESIIEFLQNRKVSFTDRSGPARYRPVYFGAAGGFVVIGMFWPAMIQMLVRAGLATAPPPREKAPEHRTGEDVDEMLVKPTAKPIDGNALGALNDQMEANLAGSLSSGEPRASHAVAEEPVSVLMSGTGARNSSDPTDQPAGPMTPQEKKDFAGQYYPVARVVKKDEDAKQ